MVALVAAACQAPLPTGVAVAYPRGLSGVEPNRDVEEFSQSILGNVFEGLVDVDGRLTLRPALAESWSSPDELTWIFRLRPGVRFHDGTALSAALVVECLEQLRQDTTRELAPALTEIASVAADDAETVRIRTRFPVPSLPYHLAVVMIGRSASPASPPVGTGPFRLVQRSPTGDATLEAFDGYWGGAPALRTLRFLAMPSPNDRVEALRTRAVDLAVDVPAASLATFAESRGIVTLSRRGLRVIFLGLDQRGASARGVFQDRRVRRALALAIDRRRLVEVALGGHGEVVDQVIAPEVFGYDSTLAPGEHDPAAARELLAAAAPDLEITLDFPAERYRAISEVADLLAHDLAAVGARVTLRPNRSEVYFDRLARGQAPLFLLGWMTGGDAPLTYDYLLHGRVLGHGSDNYTGFDDPAFDRLLEAAELASSPAERGARLREIAAFVARELPVIPLYRQFDLYALRAGLRFEPRLDRRIRGFDLRWDASAADAR